MKNKNLVLLSFVVLFLILNIFTTLSQKPNLQHSHKNSIRAAYQAGHLRGFMYGYSKGIFNDTIESSEYENQWVIDSLDFENKIFE